MASRKSHFAHGLVLLLLFLHCGLFGMRGGRRLKMHILQKMRMPGVEPGSQAWEACLIPLHYMRLVKVLAVVAHR